MQVELMEYSSDQCIHIKSHKNRQNTSYAGPIGHVEVESVVYHIQAGPDPSISGGRVEVKDSSQDC